MTIAQTFAVAPKLDPSGTSWLPVPFYALGGALALTSRALDAARVASILFAASSAALPFFALRCAGVSPRASTLAVLFAMVSPWGLWLGASTVPEVYVAALGASALVALGVPGSSKTGWALALVAACLSRYEPWPCAAVAAAWLVVQALRSHAAGPDDARRLYVASAVVAIGPLVWMLWNIHAHGSALHFFHRVATYRRALGEGAVDPLAAALSIPRLFVTTRPEVAIATVPVLMALRAKAFRHTFGLPVLAVLGQLAFLAYGAAADGAPTHHPERTLLGAHVTTALVAGAAMAHHLAMAPSRATRAYAGIVLVAAVTWLLGFRALGRAVPGRSAAEDRTRAVERGRDLRDAPALEVAPCAFEHFALIAAYGAPERVTVLPAEKAAPYDECPRVRSIR